MNSHGYTATTRVRSVIHKNFYLFSVNNCIAELETIFYKMIYLHSRIGQLYSQTFNLNAESVDFSNAFLGGSFWSYINNNSDL